MHKPALSVSSNVPVAHSCGVTLPTTQYEPVGHGAQSAAAVLPVVPEKLPASHSVGATEPAGQKPPAEHVSHAV